MPCGQSFATHLSLARAVPIILHPAKRRTLYVCHPERSEGPAPSARPQSGQFVSRLPELGRALKIFPKSWHFPQCSTWNTTQNRPFFLLGYNQFNSPAHDQLRSQTSARPRPKRSRRTRRRVERAGLSCAATFRGALSTARRFPRADLHPAREHAKRIERAVPHHRRAAHRKQISIGRRNRALSHRVRRWADGRDRVDARG